MLTSANGSYSATVSQNKVEIIGTGNEIVAGTDLVQVKFTVTNDSIITEIIH
jgi:hypothetical protein